MITFENVSKNFNNNIILNDISFTINSNELVVLIGASGCGKTTLLKLINRLTQQSSGSIFINMKNIEDEDTIKLRRKLGYVIQKVGLFPHMTVSENISLIYKLEKRRENTKKIEEEVASVMELVGLEYDTYATRYPRELSGGQQQRVGIARALITNPDIILMDEPFSALDPITRRNLQDEVVLMHQKTKTTIVFVTHDMNEALSIADRICFLHEGRVVQIDTPENMLLHPKSEEVTAFFGEKKLWFYPEYIPVERIMNESISIGSELNEAEQTDFQIVFTKNQYQLYKLNQKTKQYVPEVFSEISNTVKVSELLEQNDSTYLIFNNKTPIGVVSEKEMLFVYRQIQKEVI